MEYESLDICIVYLPKQYRDLPVSKIGKHIRTFFPEEVYRHWHDEQKARQIYKKINTTWFIIQKVGNRGSITYRGLLRSNREEHEILIDVEAVYESIVKGL